MYKNILAIMPKYPPMLLNTYPDAVIAFSLRRIRSYYFGNCLRVRRSSDNSEINIGFVNNVLDTTSLLSFVGSNDGYVTTWYDQSGNSNNATQSDTSKQPMIVSSGTVITDITTGKPSIRFKNAGLIMTTPRSTSQFVFSCFVVQRVASSTQFTIGGNSGNIYQIGITSADNYLTNIGGGAATTLQNISGNITRLLNIQRDGLNVISGYYNNTVMSTTRTNAANSTYNTIGQTNTLSTDGYISEIIWWNKNYLSSRTDINNSINAFYGLY